jgi:hypothetical protein
MMRVAAKRTGKWDSNNRRLLLSISVRDTPPDETHYFGVEEVRTQSLG